MTEHRISRLYTLLQKKRNFSKVAFYFGRSAEPLVPVFPNCYFRLLKLQRGKRVIYTVDDFTGAFSLVDMTLGHWPMVQGRVYSTGLLVFSYNGLPDFLSIIILMGHSTDLYYTSISHILFSHILDIKISPLGNLLVFQAKHFNSDDTHLYSYTLCIHYA